MLMQWNHIYNVEKLQRIGRYGSNFFWNAVLKPTITKRFNFQGQETRLYYYCYLLFITIIIIIIITHLQYYLKPL